MSIVDLLTKGLGTEQLRFLLDKLGTCNPHAPAWGGILDLKFKDPLIDSRYRLILSFFMSTYF